MEAAHCVSAFFESCFCLTICHYREIISWDTRDSNEYCNCYRLPAHLTLRRAHCTICTEHGNCTLTTLHFTRCNTNCTLQSAVHIRLQDAHMCKFRLPYLRKGLSACRMLHQEYWRWRWTEHLYSKRVSRFLLFYCLSLALQGWLVLAAGHDLSTRGLKLKIPCKLCWLKS